MSARRLKRLNVCVECHGEFHPFHADQECCTRSCGGARRARRHPSLFKAMVAADKARKAAYAKRLGARLAGLTKGEIWRQAYSRGYQVGWQKGVQYSKRSVA